MGPVWTRLTVVRVSGLAVVGRVAGRHLIAYVRLEIRPIVLFALACLRIVEAVACVRRPSLVPSK